MDIYYINPPNALFPVGGIYLNYPVAINPQYTQYVFKITLGKTIPAGTEIRVVYDMFTRTLVDICLDDRTIARYSANNRFHIYRTWVFNN